MHRHGAAVFANEGIDHLARLVECAQHHRIAGGVGVFLKLHGAHTVGFALVLALPLVERWQVQTFGDIRLQALAVVPVLWNLRHRFVVPQARLHQGNDAVQCFERQGGKLVKADFFEHANAGFGFRQRQLP